MKPAPRSNAKPARKPPRKPIPTGGKKRRTKVVPDDDGTLTMLRAILRKPRVNMALVAMMRRNIDLFPKP